MTTSIFADPALASKCFDECENVNYGKFFEKFAEKCRPFKQRLEEDGQIREIKMMQLKPAAIGATYRIFRCKVFFNGQQQQQQDEIKSNCSPFSFILKVFSLGHVNSIATNLIGEEKLDEFLDELTEIAPKNGYGHEKSGEEGEWKPKTAGEKLLWNNSFYTRTHRNECTFYEFINKSVSKGEQHPIPLPKIYFTQLCQMMGKSEEPGLIAMEDFGGDLDTVDLADGLSQEQVLLLTENIANLHAHLMTITGIGHDWRSLFKTYDEFFPEEIGNAAHGKLMEVMEEQLKDEQLAIPMKRLGRMFKETGGFQKWAQDKVEGELGIPKMLVHGNLGSDKILWQNKDPNKKLAAIIDWQLTIKGNPISDIARLMSTNVEPEVRHELEKDNRIFAQYLDKLNSKLEEKGIGPVNYGINQLEMAYNLAMIGNVVNCAMTVPLLQRCIWADKSDRHRRFARISRRVAIMMEDIVKKMEKMAPEWLSPA